METPAPLQSPALLPCPFCPGEVRPVVGDQWMMLHAGDRQCVFGVSQFRIDRWNRRAAPTVKESLTVAAPLVPALDLEAISKALKMGKERCLKTQRRYFALAEIALEEVEALRSRLSQTETARRADEAD